MHRILLPANRAFARAGVAPRAEGQTRVHWQGLVPLLTASPPQLRARRADQISPLRPHRQPEEEGGDLD